MKSKLTVGFELEIYRPAPTAKSTIQEHGFGTRADTSIKGPLGENLPNTGLGLEVVTPIYDVPVEVSATDDSHQINSTSAIRGLEALCACARHVNSTCGFHVHLGRPNGEFTTWNPRRLPNVNGGAMSEWKPSQIRTWATVGLLLENKVFELVPESRKHVKHCRRIRQAYSSTDLYSYYVVNNLVARKHDNQQRYCWLNLVETRRPKSPVEERVGYASSANFGTVEIRALGETGSPQYLSAWVNLWLKVAAAIAYLPAECAILRCASSSWLQPEIDALAAHKLEHEQRVAPLVRSVIPPSSQVNEVGDQ